MNRIYSPTDTGLQFADLRTLRVQIPRFIVLWTAFSKLQSVRRIYGAYAKILGALIWGLFMLWGLLLSSNRVIENRNRKFGLFRLERRATARGGGS
jgi:hypothetical protein